MAHENYPVDIKLDGDRDIYLDSTGDLAAVGGRPNLEQSVAIHVGDVTRKLVGNRLTGLNVGILEQRIREAVDSDPQVDDVLEVSVTEFDRQEGSIVAEVRSTENHSYTIEVPT